MSVKHLYSKKSQGVRQKQRNKKEQDTMTYPMHLHITALGWGKVGISNVKVLETILINQGLSTFSLWSVQSGVLSSTNLSIFSGFRFWMCYVIYVSLTNFSSVLTSGRIQRMKDYIRQETDSHG